MSFYVRTRLIVSSKKTKKPIALGILNKRLELAQYYLIFPFSEEPFKK